MRGSVISPTPNRFVWNVRALDRPPGQGAFSNSPALFAPAKYSVAPLLLFEVPAPVLLLYKANLCGLNRLSEEVVCADLDCRVFAGQVVLAVRISFHGERW